MRVKGILIVCAILIFALFFAPQVPAQDKTSSDQEVTSLDGIIKETQKSASGKGQAGIIWWIPTEFWEQAARKNGGSVEMAQRTFEPLRAYTLVAVAIGKLGVGNINWYNEQVIRSSVTLKDSEGAVYSPITDLSGDAKGLVSIFKPIFSNLLGSTGQNIQLLFFPARSAKGKLIADPLQDGSFTVQFSYPEGNAESQYQWRLPLSSVSPPRYCPLGKERVEANWKFCPWHGVRLDNAAGPPVSLPQSKKEDKPN